jgi:Cu+-exporting ATPase
VEEVDAVGFEAKVDSLQEKSDIRKIIEESVARYRRKVLMSSLLFLPIFFLIWVMPYVAPSQLTKYNGWNGVPLFVYLNALFATIIQVVMGTPFYLSAIKSLKHRSANMDVLVSMSTTSAWLYGVALLLVGYDYEDIHNTMTYRMQVMEHAHNFEISSALITIILIGKYIETLSKKKTVDKLAELASLKVTKAMLVECETGTPFV